jgi:ribosomal protein L13
MPAVQVEPLKEETMQQSTLMKREDLGKKFQRNWVLIDAKGKTLGRLASQIAKRRAFGTGSSGWG